MPSSSSILVNRSGGLFKIVLALCLLIAMLWWWKSIHKTPYESRTEADKTPAFFFSEFKSTIMDESGKAHYELSAAMLYHYPDDGRATMESPVLVIFRKDGGAAWHVSADSGELLDDGKQFILRKNVRLFRKQDGFAVETDSLTVWPDRSVAETDQAVVLTNSLGKVDALGLWADFSKEQLVLLSRVRGYYGNKNS